MLNRYLLVSGCVVLATCSVGYAQPNRLLPMHLTIESQPLDRAIYDWAQQTGYQVLLSDSEAGAQAAPTVKGSYTAEGALKMLLARTELRYVFVNASTVAIHQDRQNLQISYGSPRLDFTQAELATDGGGGGPVSAAGSSSAQRTDAVEQVVVTAQKRSENVKDVPISISVLGGADLDKSSVTSLMDALHSVPGVATVETGTGAAGTMLMIRGVGAAGAIFNGASPIGYYLDSIPFGLVKSALIPDQAAYDLARVEVLRGPQGTLYGANSENGLVRVLTKDPDLDKFELKARTTLSSMDGGGGNYRGDMAVNVPIIDGKLAARAAVGYEDLSGWVNGPVGNHLNDAQLRNYRLKVNAQPIDPLTIGLSAWSTRDDYGAGNSSADNGRITATIPQPIADDYDAYGFNVGYEFSGFSIASTTSYLDYEFTGLKDFTPLGIPGGALFTDYKSRVFTQEVVLNSAQGSAWRWTAGAIYRDGKDKRVQSLPAAGIFRDFADISQSYAAYGQFGRRFSDGRFEWTLGLRRFHDDVTNKYFVTGAVAKASFNSTTPRAVLTWYPSSDLTFYGSYSEGFRSGFPQNVGIGIPANFPALKPDKLHNYEIGAKADTLEGRLSLEGAVYYIKWKDVQQTIGVPFAGTTITAPVNGESASGVGVDLSVITRPFTGFEFGLTGSWNDLTFDADIRSGPAQSLLFHKGDRLALSPEYTVGTWAGYTFPLGNNGYTGRLSLSASYTSPTTDRLLGVTAVLAPSDSILIGRSQFAISSPSRWTAALFIDNFNNEDGAIATGSPVELSPRVRPRTYGLQVDFQF